MTQSTTTILKEIIKEIEGMKKKEGKHDGHENDSRSWCYSCNESGKEEELLII